MKLKPKSILGLSIRAQIKDGLKGKRPWRGWDSCHSEEGRDGTKNEKEQPWKQIETRATCRRRKEKDLKEEKCRRLEGSLSSGPDVLFQQLNLVIKIPIFPSSPITAAHLEQYPSDKTVFQVSFLQRLSFSSPPQLTKD